MSNDAIECEACRGTAVKRTTIPGTPIVTEEACPECNGGSPKRILIVGQPTSLFGPNILSGLFDTNPGAEIKPLDAVHIAPPIDFLAMQRELREAIEGKLRFKLDSCPFEAGDESEDEKPDVKERPIDWPNRPGFVEFKDAKLFVDGVQMHPHVQQKGRANPIGFATLPSFEAMFGGFNEVFDSTNTGDEIDESIDDFAEFVETYLIDDDDEKRERLQAAFKAYFGRNMDE